MINYNHTPKKVIAQSTARMLLDIGAVHVNSVKPFVLTSGSISPVILTAEN